MQKPNKGGWTGPRPNRPDYSLQFKTIGTKLIHVREPITVHCILGNLFV